MANTKVLVADVPEEDEKIRECLPDHELVFVRTLSDAIRALRANGYRLVVIGMHLPDRMKNGTENELFTDCSPSKNLTELSILAPA